MEKVNPETLIWKYLDGNLDDEKISILTEWLCEDSENAHTFLIKSSIHRQLKDVFREGAFTTDSLSKLSTLVDGYPTDLAHVQLIEESIRTSAESASVRRRILTYSLAAGVLAASLVTFIFFSTGMLRWPSQSSDMVVAAANPSAGSPEDAMAGGDRKYEATGNINFSKNSEPFAAATITGVLDASWEDESTSANYGEPLLEGRKLNLKAGLVQLTFESGAKLLVQGPTEFLVQSDMRGLLDRGKITAVVPSRAHGFTVRTPSAEIIDLGTEFALQVDTTGSAEVHVFDGEVVTQALDQDGILVGDLVHVTEEKAVRYTTDSSAVSTINYNENKFRRELEPRLMDDELPALPVRKDLVLWLAADQLVKLDENNRVVAWRDILTGDNQSAEDALQHIPEIRPYWVEDGINQQPALRFTGSSNLITTPLETTNDQTVSLVFSINRKAIERGGNGGQILSYNGPPHRYISSMAQPGVLQIGDFNSRERGHFSAFVYCMNNGQGIQSGDAAKYKLKPNEPIVMTYVYDRSNKQAKLYVNGEILGTCTASSLPAITSRKVIGRHGAHPDYFIGDLAELLIYNAPLEKSDCDSLNQYLMERYQIYPQNQGAL